MTPFRSAVRSARAPLALLAVAVLGLAPAAAQTLPRETRLRLMESVVQIVPLTDAGKAVGTSGSGTIISPEGHILTNYHVIGDLDTRRTYRQHAILFTAYADQAPQFRYVAEVAATDPAHDLAILRVTTDRDGKRLAAGTRFSPVPVGDSNTLIPGDPIFMVGYPGVSGSTVTFTTGSMSGWLGEDFEAGGKQWIKTDGKIGHGNSGGAAFNERGELVGVPTAGRTLRYENSTTEQQAYVRPIALAWGVIGPNVPSVARSSPAAPRASAPASSGTAPAATRTALAWPPALAVGQSWTLTVAGQAPWRLTVGGQKADGDFTGRLGSGQNVLAYYIKEDDVFVFQIAEGEAATFCAFDRKSLGAADMTGSTLHQASKNAELKSLGKTCTASLATGAAASAPGLAVLAWPPALAVGQTWTLSIAGQAPWRLTVGEKNSQGDHTARATNGGPVQAALVYHIVEDDLFVFQIREGEATTFCTFDAKSRGASTLSGLTLHKASQNAEVKNLNKTCVATFGG